MERWIVGQLDLYSAISTSNIFFSECHFENEPILMSATIRGTLGFGGSYVPGIAADGLRTISDIFLRNGFKAGDEVRLLGANIGGDLDCTNSKLEAGKSGRTLNADGIKVDRSVFLRDGFNAVGEVGLIVAEIRGNLDCSNAEFKTKESGVALELDSVQVGGGIYF